MIHVNNELGELVKKLERMKEEYENTYVKCGIIGMSGSGKSSLINAIVGEKIAEVGVVEQTSEPQEYRHQGIIFVDLPGIGTSKWPKDTYVSDLKLNEYDCFILVTAARFFENDVYLYNEIKNNLGKSCFVVRNQFDRAIEDNQRDNNKTEEETREIIVNNIIENLQPNKVDKVYLTSARYPKNYDLPILIEDIYNSLSGIKRNRFIADVAALSDTVLVKKKKVAENLVGIYAGLAAANGLNPIPGLDISVDLGILTKLSYEVVKIYGLTEKQVDYYLSLSSKTNKQAIKQRIILITANYLTEKGILKILENFGGKIVVKEISKWIPFVGQLISSGISYKLTYSFGERLIEECENIARELVGNIVAI